MKNIFMLTLAVVFLNSNFALADVINYVSGATQFEGQFLKSKKAKAPAILVIHNWMGSTSETLKQAKRFNSLGYNVFVADIYGLGVRPKDAAEAGKLATMYKSNRQLFRERIELAYQEMLKQKSVDINRTAIVGYCFGGTGALEAARSNSKLKGAISFHGGLDSLNPVEGALIKSKVLILHGANDPYVAAKDIDALEKELKDNQVQFELIKFSNAVHSFTEVGAGDNAATGAAYNKQADEKSFLYAQIFLTEAFK